jgi:hypothetical protein
MFQPELTGANVADKGQHGLRLLHWGEINKSYSTLKIDHSS